MNMSEMGKLVDRYLYLNEAYYNGDAVASDREFDNLKKDIYKYRDVKEYASVISRIDIIGTPSKLAVIKHNNRMYSLDNVFNIAELEEWVNKHPSNTMYSLELKYDGASLDVNYPKGGLFKALTRGDGVLGGDVTDNVGKYLPRKIGEEDINVHGEIIISFKEFDLANVKRLADNVKPYLSPRNAASSEMMHGSGYAKLQFIPYGMYRGDTPIDMEEVLKVFPKHNVPYHNVYNKETLIKEAEKLYNVKNKSIPTDGLVIKIMNKDIVSNLGYTSKFPRFAIALKFPETDSTTILKDIIWSVGHTGVLTPVGLLEPIEMHDCVVSRVTLNNMKFVLTTGLSYNDKVMIIRSGGVVPKLTGVLSKDAAGLNFIIPSKCPCCSEATSVLGPNLLCTNDVCSDRVISRLTRFVSRDYADVKGVSRQLISKLYTLGIRDIPSLITVTDGMLRSAPGLKDKSVTNILTAIDSIHGLPMDKFLASLGIDGLGKTTSKLVASNIECVDDILALDLSSIPNIGKSTAISIMTGLIKRIDEVRELESLLVPNKVHIKVDKPTVCFTGTFDAPRKVLEREIIADGYEVVKSVTKKLDLLIVGKNPSSKLSKCKKIGTAEIRVMG